MNTQDERNFALELGYMQGAGPEIAHHLFSMADEIDRLTAERDAALAKLAALAADTTQRMEQIEGQFAMQKRITATALDERAALAAQEPVALLAQGISGGIVGAERLYFPQERNEAIEFCAAAHEKGGYPVTEISPLYAAAGAAPVPEGWRLVPVDPTPLMCAEGLEDEGCTVKDGKRFARALYSAMLKAAPKEQV